MQERERELERDFIFYHLIAFDIERERKREKKSILYPYKFRKTDENVAGNIVENIHDKISLFLGLIYPRNILPLLFSFYFFFFLYIYTFLLFNAQRIVRIEFSVFSVLNFLNFCCRVYHTYANSRCFSGIVCTFSLYMYLSIR